MPPVMTVGPRCGRWWLFLVLFAWWNAGSAGEAYLAIIIDDLGDNLESGQRALELPAGVTLSFLPGRPYTQILADRAYRSGRTLMLHLPMQPIGDERMGGGGLHISMDESRLRATLRDNLARLPQVVGINNHMGSLLTRDVGAMSWLMSDLRRRGDLLFIDSRTTGRSIAGAMAAEYGVPFSVRDVFLDNVRDEQAIERQLDKLLHLARRRGFALAIGHPYDETLEVLENWLPWIEQAGVRLLSIDEYVQRQQRSPTWHVSLSRLRKAVKN